MKNVVKKQIKMKAHRRIITEMMSKIPSSNNGDNIDNQLLRIGILSEFDAVNLYEQLSYLATDETVKEIFLDIAKEEKVHVSEFQTILNKLDKETKETTKQGEDESEDIEDEQLDEAKTRLYGKTATQQLNEMIKVFNKLK